jgi:hypothetical protein
VYNNAPKQLKAKRQKQKQAAGSTSFGSAAEDARHFRQFSFTGRLFYRPAFGFAREWALLLFY